MALSWGFGLGDGDRSAPARLAGWVAGRPAVDELDGLPVTAQVGVFICIGWVVVLDRDGLDNF
jgi:hypothetical protein